MRRPEFRSSRGLRSVPARGDATRAERPLSFGALAVAIGIALGVGSLAPSPAVAGVCKVDTRTYCVSGLSTPADWTWSTHEITSTVDAVLAGLSMNDPADAIVAVMVADMVAKGLVAVVASPTSCFDVDSCDDLVIDGSTVSTSTPVSFNPLIIQVLPEPTSLAMLAAGGALVVGLRRRRHR